MPVTVAFEDETLLIIDKPQGLPVTPGVQPSLCDQLFADRPGLSLVRGLKAGEGGLLNRLDNDTGGLVLLAKTNDGFRYYHEEMKKERIRKTYLAVVHGQPERDEGVIDLPLGHSRKSARRMLATQAPQKIRGRSRNAHTAWRVLENKPPYSLLEIDIAKGVHHQIRVHAATMECPIVGDKLYNKKGSALLVPYHLLYCFSICLHTINGAPLHVNVSVPFRHTWYEWTADK